VDVSMFDAMVSAMASNFANFLGSGVLPKPLGTAFPTIVPYKAFACADRPIVIAVASEKLWQAFCPAIGHPELASEPEYATNALRVANREALEARIEQIFRTDVCARWVARLAEAGIPATPIRTLDEVVADPQSEARELFTEAGGLRVTGMPVKLSEAPGRVRHRAPRLGEHTRTVLNRILQLSAGDLEELNRAGVIA
jgi:crotonobetainyl-CoA:carnitine CoA-transferase CaiB-like acyl-CoA transferase